MYNLKDSQKIYKVDLIISQIIGGIGSGFVGFVLFGLISPSIFGRLDLFASILYALGFGYVSTYMGIAIISFITLKEFISKIQVRNIFQLTFPSVVLTIYLFIFSNSYWSWLLGSVMSAYSIIGLIWEFNRILQKRNKDEK